MRWSPVELRKSLPDIHSIAERYRCISATLQRLAYPFDRGGGQTDVYGHLCEDLPPPREEHLGELIEHAVFLVQAITQLHIRVMGRLAHLASDYEATLGVAPIKIVI